LYHPCGCAVIIDISLHTSPREQTRRQFAFAVNMLGAGEGLGGLLGAAPQPSIRVEKCHIPLMRGQNLAAVDGDDLTVI